MSSNFKIRYRASDRFVRILFLGSTGLQTHLRAGRQLVARFRHLGRLRILADMRYAGFAVSAEEQELLVGFVREQPVLSRARIAVLNQSGISAMALTVEQLARRGQDSRLFAVETEAINWLQSPMPLD